jgi:hypothetical protein
MITVMNTADLIKVIAAVLTACGLHTAFGLWGVQ